MAYFLKTERLGFRCWAEEDLALVTTLWCDAEVTGLIGGPFSTEQAQARLGTEIAHCERHGVQYWPVFLLEYGQHVGCAGLQPYGTDEGVYEMGIHLLPAFWRCGLGTEAARAIVDHAFGELGAEAVVARHHPENGGSRRLMEVLEFEYTDDQLYGPTGLMHPSYILRSPQTTQDTAEAETAGRAG